MNDYISLTKAVEQSQDKLGLSNWQQLFELAQEESLPIYYQLAYSDRTIYFADFPLGDLSRGSGVGGGKGLRHYTTYNDCFGNRIGSKNDSPLSREDLGNNGYSQCMDIAIQECGRLSFSRFFNDELFKREIDRCIQHYKTPPLFPVTNESAFIIPRPQCVAFLLFIADKYKETLGELPKYVDTSGATNYEKLKSDCLAGVESRNFFFLFADHSSITDTGDNFYLLRTDFERLGGGDIDNKTMINFHRLSSLFERKTKNIELILERIEARTDENGKISYGDIKDTKWRGGGLGDKAERTFNTTFMPKLEENLGDVIYQ